MRALADICFEHEKLSSSAVKADCTPLSIRATACRLDEEGLPAATFAPLAEACMFAHMLSSHARREALEREERDKAEKAERARKEAEAKSGNKENAIDGVPISLLVDDSVKRSAISHWHQVTGSNNRMRQQCCSCNWT
jgi:type III secretory pathway component EscV